MDFLKELQSLPEKKRRIILWTAVAVIGLSLSFVLIKNFQKKLEDFKMEEFKKDLNLEKLDIPKVEIPK
ncbi:MAG: hypothetical protein PHE52_00020 [Candidatus Pacebacteria bacterium]|nr:hypothetical protein [Candidatus Paceibacterota bacterium]